MSKIETYLGLSRKSNQIVIGQDNLKRFSKKLYLIVVSLTATDNLKDLAIRLAEKFKCDLVQTLIPLEEIIHINGCKIIGLTSNTLSEAIINNTNEYNLLRSRNG